ncbi:unnamed protein product [Paramecium pentaurelia]|uniref:Transmembrane protein n=1 Tax=Paramecium pentaurelia TaxID=43138 RepID=A0A8S1UIX5_9CILI|nr:unnamed protein product [Paramecium pentaurelia]
MGVDNLQYGLGTSKIAGCERFVFNIAYRIIPVYVDATLWQFYSNYFTINAQKVGSQQHVIEIQIMQFLLLVFHLMEFGRSESHGELFGVQLATLYFYKVILVAFVFCHNKFTFDKNLIIFYKRICFVNLIDSRSAQEKQMNIRKSQLNYLLVLLSEENKFLTLLQLQS